MADTAPGTITDASGWPGRWETVSREDYWQIIAGNGGLDALGVAASCTEERYVLTAWARRDQDYPLVQSVMRDCDPSLPVGDYAKCPGIHAFQKFVYDPAMAEED